MPRKSPSPCSSSRRPILSLGCLVYAAPAAPTGSRPDPSALLRAARLELTTRTAVEHISLPEVLAVSACGANGRHERPARPPPVLVQSRSCRCTRSVGRSSRIG